MATHTHTTRCRARFDEIFAKEGLDEAVPPLTATQQVEQNMAGPVMPPVLAAPLGQASSSSQGAAASSQEKRGRDHAEEPIAKQLRPSVADVVLTPVPAVHDQAMGSDDPDAMDVKALCEENIEKPDFDEYFSKTGVFHDFYTGEALPKELVTAAVRNELAEMDAFEVMQWRRRSDKPEGVKVISTKLFHKLKDETTVRSRIVARQFADSPAPEHHAGTPPVWALKLVLSRCTSRGRGRQLASHDISVAFFHAALEQPVWAEPPKELGLEDWLWYVEKALYGMRESSKAFQTEVNKMFVEAGWSMLKTVPCLAYQPDWDCLSGFHGDDFYTEGEAIDLDKVDDMITSTFKANILPRIGPQACSEGSPTAAIVLE